MVQIVSTKKDKTPVAQDVFTWCTREKTETWHVVRNHASSGIVDRVVCKACGSEHKYRREKTETTPRPGAAKVVIRGNSAAATAANSEALETNWFAGIKKWGTKAVRAFDPATTFRVGEVLEHAVFGKGVVQGRRENKIDVLFKAGVKTLPSAEIRN